jgi:uncharacterized protein (DUF302 family)
MLFIVETAKDFETAAKDLEEAVKRRKYGVLHVHDLKKTLESKGIDFPSRVKIFEVCNPQRAERVLTDNLTVNLALPCRISVFEDGGKVKIGMIRPSFLLSVFPDQPGLKTEAEAVEKDTVAIIEDAK